MKSGDIVYDADEEMFGILLYWLSIGNPGGIDLWEVFYENGETRCQANDCLRIVNVDKKIGNINVT